MTFTWSSLMPPYMPHTHTHACTHMHTLWTVVNSSYSILCHHRNVYWNEQTPAWTNDFLISWVGIRLECAPSGLSLEGEKGGWAYKESWDMPLTSPGAWLCHMPTAMTCSKSFNFSGPVFLLSKMGGLGKMFSEDPSSTNLYIWCYALVCLSGSQTLADIRIIWKAY